MNKDEIKKKAEEVFTFLYTKGVTSSFRFPKGYGASILDTFADKLLEKESGIVGSGIIVDFCIHQVYLWRDHKRWKHFNITWAFGQKGIDRFYTSKSGVRYYQDEWLDWNEWTRESLKAQFTTFKVHPLVNKIYIEAEDTTKLRHLNTEAGMGLCFIMTSLFSPKSPACQKCDYKNKCESLLRKTNPELHRLRLQNK